jgi:S1-C subfamily serine protease
MRAIVAVAMALVLASVATAAFPLADALKAQSYQLFVRVWGGLAAICSTGAYWTNGQVTRLLTAGHCVAIGRLLLGNDVEFLVSQTGSEFVTARVVASGWMIRQRGSAGWAVRDISEVFGALPAPGFLRKFQFGNAIDTRLGDWAVLEVQGKRPVPPGGPSSLAEGDEVVMFGYPLGGDRFLSRGYLANLSYRAPGTEWPSGYYAADITALPGNSGSVAVDLSGRPVGILVAGSIGSRLMILTPFSMVEKSLPCLRDAECAQPSRTQ